MISPEQLKQELKRPGRTQAALAKALGVDTSAVNRLVNGRRELKAKEVEAVEAYLAETETATTPLAERLRDRMFEVGTNPARAALDSGLGIDYVRDILRGKVKSPSAEALAAIAKTLDCSMAYLHSGEGGPPSPGGRGTAGSTPRGPLAINVGSDGLAHIQVDARVPTATALKIMALIEEAKPA